MTTIYLVRHAAHDRVRSVLCGRMAGVSLGPQGRGEAARVAESLRGTGAVSILTSPLARAAETAAIIATTLGLTFETSDALNEIDFGAWTGRRFDSLEGDPDWAAWNTSRATSRPLEGESMVEAQARIVTCLQRFEQETAGPAILVSHGDLIKAAILWVLGLSLSAYDRFDIDPASLTTLVLWPGGGRVVALNERVADERAGGTFMSLDTSREAPSA